MSKKQPSPNKSSKASGTKDDHSGQKGFKKFFKGDKGKSSGFNEDKPGRKFSGERERYKRSAGNEEDESSRGVFRRDEKAGRRFSDEGRNSRKPFGDGGVPRASFRRDGKPGRDFTGDNKDRKRSFDKDGGTSRGTFRRDEETQKKGGEFSAERKLYKRSSDKDGAGFKAGKSFSKKAGKDQEVSSRPNRYAHVFGKLDDEELAAHQQKLKAKKEEEEKGDEVSFSKSLERWEDDADSRQPQAPDFYSKRKESESDGKKERHNKKDKFRRNFDSENDYEKAYAAKADGRVRKRKVADEVDEDDEDDDVSKPVEGKMPLNKYIAHCDVCSRRDAVALIKEGKVKVNGIVVTEPGYKVSQGEEITLNDKKLAVQKNLVYILLNKPKGYITTTDDPKGRKTVMDIVENYIDERVFPIGRLDRNTTGLLLLTNDGELAQKLSHPKYEVRKVYQVKLDRAVAKADYEKIVAGITLEDGPVKVDAIEYLDTKDEIGLEIHSGKNRIVRRIFESLGYEVEKLDRVMYAGLTKKNILRGKWRFLSKQEVINLKHFK